MSDHLPSRPGDEPPLQITPSTMPQIKVTPSTMPKLDPAAVAAALGAVPTGVTVPAGGSPMTKFAAGRETYLGVQAALGAVSTRITPDQRRRLEKLAADVARPGFTPSPEQVAGVLLAWALERVEKGELPDALRAPAADPPATPG